MKKLRRRQDPRAVVFPAMDCLPRGAMFGTAEVCFFRGGHEGAAAKGSECEDNERRGLKQDPVSF